MRRIVPGTLALIIVATLVAACDDEDEGVVIDATEGSGAITLVAEGRSLSEQRIEVDAGTTTTVTLRNDDTTPHTLTVYVAAEATGDIAADSGEVPPGEAAEVVVFFSAPGTHAFRCEIHRDAMRGTIVVR